MKITTQAPSNIALIKYWGKADRKLRLPLNSTISVNLSGLSTTTTVEFSPRYDQDNVFINDLNNEKSILRTIKHLDRIRKLAGKKLRARVVSKNNFAGAAGLASSASGFAALTLAATKAIGLDLSEKELTILARQGSGSACRSIPNGWVKWEKGKDNQSSFSYSLYSKDYWSEICILSIIVEAEKKKVLSTGGMTLSYTSPFFKLRLLNIDKKIVNLEKAIAKKDFKQMGQIIEDEALELHAITLTQKPALIYWQPSTLTVMKRIKMLREKSLFGYFTMDAGPHLQIFCLKNNCKKIADDLKKIRGVKQIITNKIVDGAYLTKKHIF